MPITLGRFGIWNPSLRFGEEKQACVAAASAELGFTTLWVPEGIPGAGGEELFGRLAALLDATSRITIATGILNIWMHDARTVGARYAELAEWHPGRLLLGLGSATPPSSRTPGSAATPAR